jgi:hypothetical protein
MRTVGAYLAALAAAGFVFALAFAFAFLVQAGNSVVPTPAFMQVEQLAVWFAIDFVAFCVIGVVATFAPFMVINEIASSLRLGSRAYFAGAGGLLGAVCSAPVAWMFSSLHGWYTDLPDYQPAGFAFWLVRLGPTLIAAGLIGGLTYWYLAGRHVRGRRGSVAAR